MEESRFYSSKSQEAQEQLVEWNGEAQPEGSNICSLWRLSSAVWAKRMATYVEMSVLDLFFPSAWLSNTIVFLFFLIWKCFHVHAVTFDLMVGSSIAALSKCHRTHDIMEGKKTFLACNYVLLKNIKDWGSYYICN